MASPGLSEADLQFLRRAISLGRQGMEAGAGGPFGAVVVQNGSVEGEGFNRVLADGDPTAHAEINAIRAAAARGGEPWLGGATLYASCEPCPMCLGAIHWARIDRVVYAAQREDAAAIGFDDAAFYEEFSRAPQERRLQLRQSLRDDAREMMEAWKSRGPDSVY